jgi:hypothetical protein
MSLRPRLRAGGTLVLGDHEQSSDRWSPMNFPTSFIFRIPESIIPHRIYDACEPDVLGKPGTVE